MNKPENNVRKIIVVITAQTSLAKKFKEKFAELKKLLIKQYRLEINKM